MSPCRQVDHDIDVVEGAAALHGLGGIGDEPGLDAGPELGFPPHQPADVVSRGEKVADQRPSDEPAGAGHQHASHFGSESDAGGGHRIRAAMNAQTSHKAARHQLCQIP